MVALIIIGGFIVAVYVAGVWALCVGDYDLYLKTIDIFIVVAALFLFAELAGEIWTAMHQYSCV